MDRLAVGALAVRLFVATLASAHRVVRRLVGVRIGLAFELSLRAGRGVTRWSKRARPVRPAVSPLGRTRNGRPLQGLRASTALVLLALVLLPSGHPVQAQQAGSTSAARAVWIGDIGGYPTVGLLKVNAADASVLLEIANPGGVVALATDDARQVVWTFSAGVLRAYDFSGALRHSISVPYPYPYSPYVALNPDDGSVWLGMNTTLRHFDAQGQLLLTVSLSLPPQDGIRDLAVDAQRMRVWVRVGLSLQAYDAAGQLVQTVEVALGQGQYLWSMALEPTTGQLWAGVISNDLRPNELRRYSAAGSLDAALSLAHFDMPDFLASDGAGGIWVGTGLSETGGGRVQRFDAAGQLVATWSAPSFSDAYGGEYSRWLNALAADSTDQSAWVSATPMDGLCCGSVAPGTI